MTSLLVDAGFLVALWTPGEQHHLWADATARTKPPPWNLCEAVLSETDHLLEPVGRVTLRTAMRRGALRVVPVLSGDWDAILNLQDKYEDLPMSVADACLVRLSEILPDPLVLTTGRHFKIYRRHSRKVVPCLLP